MRKGGKKQCKFESTRRGTEGGEIKQKKEEKKQRK
jgi:hypothetical protein